MFKKEESLPTTPDRSVTLSHQYHQMENLGFDENEGELLKVYLGKRKEQVLSTGSKTSHHLAFNFRDENQDNTQVKIN